MKLNLMPMLLGAIALTVAATPLVIKAEANTSEPLFVTQAQPQQGQQRGRFAKLNLTQQQKDQIKQIRRDTRSQMQAILTPQQLEQFKAAKRNKQGMRAAIAAMNLSDQQKAQLRTLRQSAKAKIQALLTQEQRQQLQQTMQEMRQQRQQRNQSRPAS